MPLIQPGFAAAMLLMMPVAASAQQAAEVSQSSPAVRELVEDVSRNLDHYRATLPSLSADEAIESEGSYMVFGSHARSTGTMRAVRESPNGPLKESRAFVTFNGKPAEAGHQYHLPVFLSGGFDQFADLVLLSRNRPCYEFTLLPAPGPGGSLQIAARGVAAPYPALHCGSFHRLVTALIRVDRVTHQIVHYERTVAPPELALADHLAPYAAIDCAPAKIGDETYWVPTLVVGRMDHGHMRGSFTAHYTNYHRYAASVTLLPGSNVVSPDAEPAPATPAPPSSTPR